MSGVKDMIGPCSQGHETGSSARSSRSAFTARSRATSTTTDADDPEGQVVTARVGPESMDRGLKPGDRIRLHFVLGAVTDVTRADEPAA